MKKKQIDWFLPKAIIVSLAAELLIVWVVLGFDAILEMKPKELGMVLGGSIVGVTCMDCLVVTLNKQSDRIERQLLNKESSHTDKKVQKERLERDFEQHISGKINKDIDKNNVPSITRDLKEGESPNQYRLQKEQTINALAQAFRK